MADNRFSKTCSSCLKQQQRADRQRTAANKPVPESPHRSSSPIQYGSGDEQEVDEFAEQITKKAEILEEAAAILRSQLQFKNLIWMKALSDEKFGRDIMHFVDDIRLYERTGRKRETTWAEGRPKSEK
ncbi:hypothetical protein C0993_009551 [Termitomyces sp. T159_Od127]|nr:hypothetical protein C0993_009551 [Termitomyces sp. T159_Od127]